MKWLRLPLTLLGTVSGCGGSWGPAELPGVEVVGSVRIGERPVGSGWVVFQPIDGGIGPQRSAPLNPDGSFRATGVGIGPNQIRVEHPDPPLPPASAIDRRIAFESFTSPIRRVIQPGSRLAIDLLAERDKALQPTLSIHSPRPRASPPGTGSP